MRAAGDKFNVVCDVVDDEEAAATESGGWVEGAESEDTLPSVPPVAGE
jgi:hypothetical protein